MTYLEDRRPIAIDLFSGAGGLSLGFEAAGFDIVSAVEYDPVHAATHLYNFPLTDVLCADVSSVSSSVLLRSARRGWDLHNPGVPWDGTVDAIIGGPSCQGFSTMGKQDASDERNQLIFEFVRLVKEIRPRSFCMENVPGFLDPRFDSIRERALQTLRSAGYHISGHESPVKAENYGVPQKRRRVIILGVLEGNTAPAPLAQKVKEPYNVADAFEGLPELWRIRPIVDSDVLPLTTNMIRRRSQADGRFLDLAGILSDGSRAFGHARQVSPHLLAGCRTTTHTRESVMRFAATSPGTKEPVSRFHRLSLHEPALTLRAGTGRERGAFSAARPLHPISPRVITVREAARLHSFPDWFRFHTTNWHGHRQVGNAVPPLLAQAAAESLLQAMGHVPCRSSREPIPLGDTRLLTLTPTAAAKWFEVPVEQVPMRRRPVATSTSETSALGINAYATAV